jgi:CRISPR-associated Csx14 family protein
LSRSNQTAILIATLGTEPQVVSAALDLLLRQDAPVSETLVLHTSGAAGSSIRLAVERLEEAFRQDPYAGLITLKLQPLLDENGRPLPDVDTPPAARAAFRSLYRAIRAAKQAGKAVHLSIAGGRKTLAVFGMAAAQLLFDENDCLWHLYSDGEFLESKRLHPAPGDDVHLVPIPLILWGQVSPILTGVVETDDPYEAVERAQALRLAERLEAARAFVLDALTPAEQRVAALLVREGLTDAEIGERLALSPRTVEHHLRAAYSKAASHWEVADIGRAQLVALLNLYYLTEAPGGFGKAFEA